MVSKTLIIAPHPDDEINLAGQLIIKLVRLNVEIYVLYTTNGDAEKKIGNRRIKEAIKANKLLGIDKQHVIFLGYPNEWRGEKHIYNAAPTETLVSKLGKTETNSIATQPEYCFIKQGAHHLFTRENFKKDYKSVIKDILPDLIVCPEFDSHPDHRTAALLFDEIIGELLKEKSEYRPIILKKYDHEGVWYGPKDYYSIPMIPTLTTGARAYSGGMHDLDSPNYKWNDRITYKTEADTNTELIKNNIIYKAAKQHKLTTAWYEMQRVINGDMVYWLRPTKNLALNAIIECSSGNSEFINDFKQFDTDNVKEIREPFLSSNCFCWIPSKADLKKEGKIRLKEISPIKYIRVYEDCNFCNHIIKLQIKIGLVYLNIIELQNDGSMTEILLDNVVYSDSINFKIIEWEGIPGIAEIEVYSEEPDTKSLLPIDLYICADVKYKTTFIQKLERYCLMVKFLFVYKLSYEIKKRLKK